MKRRYSLLLLSAAAVVIVAALGLCNHSSAPVGATATRSTSRSPSATTSPVSPSPAPVVAGPVPGVTVAVCHVSSVKANFGIGSSARAFVYSIRTEAKCESGQAFVVVATKSGIPSAPFGPIVCVDIGHCRILATPDVDGNGRADLAVGQFSLFWITFDLFRIEKGTPPRIVPYAIRHRSGKLTPLVNGHALPLGGTTQVMSGVICGPSPGTVVVWSASETIEGNGPYAVEQWTCKIEGSALVLLSRRSSMLAQSQHYLLPQHGGLPFDETLGLCGQPLLR